MKPLFFLSLLFLTGCDVYVIDNYSHKIIMASEEKCIPNGGLKTIDFASGVFNSETDKLKYTQIGITCQNGASFRFTLEE